MLLLFLLLNAFKIKCISIGIYLRFILFIFRPSRPMSPVPQFLNVDKKSKEDTNITTSVVPINQIIETVDCAIINKHSKEEIIALPTPIKTDYNSVSNYIKNETETKEDNKEKCDNMKNLSKNNASGDNKTVLITDNIVNHINNENNSKTDDCSTEKELNNCDISNDCCNGSIKLSSNNNSDKNNVKDKTDKISDFCNAVNSLDISSDDDTNKIKSINIIDEEGKDVIKLYEKEVDLQKIVNRNGDNDVGNNENDENIGVISNLPRDLSVETLGETTAQNNMVLISQINAQLCGVPLPIFTQVSIQFFIYFNSFLPRLFGKFLT